MGLLKDLKEMDAGNAGKPMLVRMGLRTRECLKPLFFGNGLAVLTVGRRE